MRIVACNTDEIVCRRHATSSGNPRARAIRERVADHLHFRAFDLGRTGELPAFVKELRNAFGAIYGLVSNAGIGTEGLLATMRNSKIEALIRLNMLSPIVLTKYVVRRMMADGAVRSINISFIIASTGHNGLSDYAACKAAVGFSRSLARQVGRLGITVNAIAPGFIDTELTGSLDDDSRHVSPAAARCAACLRPMTSRPCSNISSEKAAGTSPAPF